MGAPSRLTRSSAKRPGARAERAPGEPRAVGYLYVAPALILFSAFVLFPMLHNGWLSFFEWDGVTNGVWVGLKNYGTILHSGEIHAAFGHVLILLIFYAVLPVALGLMLAALISRVKGRAAVAYQVIIFSPQVIATVALAVGWIWIFAPDGPLNSLLAVIGLGSLRQPWLGSFTYALPAIGVIGTWITTGLATVLFLAGIQRIPKSLYDAARVDGCGPVKEFFTVTLPGLRGELSVVMVITIILGLRTFDVVYVTTSGGPGKATMVPSLFIFEKAFRENQVGLACATATVLTVLILVITVVVRRLVEGKAR
jgi:raffinose/stachyose/melibiose transport system permease protein